MHECAGCSSRGAEWAWNQDRASSAISIMAQGCRIRHQGNGSCPFDGPGQLSLVLGAISRYTPWNDLAAFCGEKPKRPRILIIDSETSVCAEPTDLSPAEQSSLSLMSSHLLVPPGHRCLAGCRSVQVRLRELQQPQSIPRLLLGLPPPLLRQVLASILARRLPPSQP